MKLAYHCGTHLPSDLATDIKAAAHAGFTGLEVRGDKILKYLEDHSVNELDKLLKEYKVEPTAINSIEFIGFKGEGFKDIQDQCKNLSEICEGIGCRALVVVPSPTPVPEGDLVMDLFFPWEKVLEEYCKVLTDLEAIARPRDVTLAFEFIGAPWSSVRTPRGTYEIVQKVNSDFVGLNFDAAHFFTGGGEMKEINMLDPKKIVTFHLNDMEDCPKEAQTDIKRMLPGEGIIPLDEICSNLKEIGYNGRCAIEIFRKEYWDNDPFELAEKSRKCCMKILSKYFDIE